MFSSTGWFEAQRKGKRQLCLLLLLGKKGVIEHFFLFLYLLLLLLDCHCGVHYFPCTASRRHTFRPGQTFTRHLLADVDETFPSISLEGMKILTGCRPRVARLTALRKEVIIHNYSEELRTDSATLYKSG